MYSKAWVIPWENGRLGIAYERDDGLQGFTRVYAENLELITLLSDEDLRKLKEMNDGIPSPRS
jgi:hypothetical protein